MLFAGNSLAKAQRIFERSITKRPRVLKEWPPPNRDEPYRQDLRL